MAYLDRQLSEYKTSASFITYNENKHLKRTHKSTEEIKKSNYDHAKHLAETKANLINALAQLPIMALWLINQHEQSNDPLDQDENDVVPSDVDLLKVEIKKCFLELHSHVLGNKVQHASYAICKQRLIIHLQHFSFSFNDLVEITNLVVYFAKKKNVLSHTSSTIASNNGYIIHQRLYASLLPDNAKLLEKFNALHTTEYNEDFLFSSNNDISGYLSDIILAEQLWLEARKNLVMANSKLVSFIVNQYKGNFLDFNDLVQEGQTGLLKAVDRFDHRLGFQFSTYASYWIRQAISRSLSSRERSVRIPCEQIATINRVFRTKDQLTTQLAREPSIQEIATNTQLSCDEIYTILSISQSVVPLEGAEDEDNEPSFAPVDFIEQQTFTQPIDKIAESELKVLLTDALKILNPREARVVSCHFGVQHSNEMTLQEIGEELNLTRERVRQIQVVALNKIKLNYGQQLINFL